MGQSAAINARKDGRQEMSYRGNERRFANAVACSPPFSGKTSLESWIWPILLENLVPGTQPLTRKLCSLQAIAVGYLLVIFWNQLGEDSPTFPPWKQLWPLTAKCS